jgi:hypothetical protein
LYFHGRIRTTYLRTLDYERGQLETKAGYSGAVTSLSSIRYLVHTCSSEFKTLEKFKNVVLWDLQPPVHAGSSLADFSTLKMEAIRSFETSFTQDLHSVTSQKTAFFIVTGVKTSNLEKLCTKRVSASHTHNPIIIPSI